MSESNVADGPEFYCARDVTLFDLPPRLNITCLIAANPAIGSNNVNWGSNLGQTNVSYATVLQTSESTGINVSYIM